MKLNLREKTVLHGVSRQIASRQPFPNQLVYAAAPSTYATLALLEVLGLHPMMYRAACKIF
jgi:hypothetical protein